MAQYLLPCSCGEKVRVETAQAGGAVACSCGRELSVPTLRGMRSLEMAAPDTAARQRAAGRQWSPLQGGLFSAGLLVTVVSLVTLAYTFWSYLQATPFTRDLSPEINQIESQQIDALPLTEALDEFYKMRKDGLGQPGGLPWKYAQDVVAQQRTLMIAAAIAAAIGILAVAASLFMKPSARPLEA